MGLSQEGTQVAHESHVETVMNVTHDRVHSVCCKMTQWKNQCGALFAQHNAPQCGDVLSHSVSLQPIPGFWFLFVSEFQAFWKMCVGADQ